MRSRLVGATVALVLPLATASGCKEEEGNLFDETEGTWAAVAYSLDGDDTLTVVAEARENAFMLRYQAGVVAAASCGSEDGGFGIEISSCNLLGDNREWLCDCYMYEFDGSQMRWKSYDPEVGTPQSFSGATGDIVLIDTYADPDVNDRYRYQSLPEGLFTSNGDSSIHAFQQRSAAQFADSPCLDVCGVPQD